MALLTIPDELLAEIFLRIPNAADLVRASAACVSFRRVAADRSFLRRYRKLHAPPFLGFLERREVFRPVVASRSSASAAAAVALAADFSFSFLPGPASDWVVKDTRDGRVLLDRFPQHDVNKRYNVVFPELAVCDPLHRRYRLLPPIPDNLAASVEDPLRLEQHSPGETFLAPAGDGDGDEEASAAEGTSFGVIWMAQCRTKLVAFAFSSSTGQWRAISSQSWSDLFSGLLSSTGFAPFSSRQYAYGCFYWVSDWMNMLLKLDSRRMEFSILELPPESRGIYPWDIAIVEAGKGRPGMFMRQQYTNCLKYSIRRSNCGSSGQWQSEKTIKLDSSCYLFVGSMGRHLFLYHRRSPALDAGCFSLDVHTFQLERVSVRNSYMPKLPAYSNFPPSLLSAPTVSSGIEKGAEKEMPEQGCAAQAQSRHRQNCADANARD